MARKATIIDVRDDALGDRWDVRESRPTDHGWPVLLGWPHGLRRGQAQWGGVRVIVTDRLATYLRNTRLRDIVLPIGLTTTKRLRKVLGLHWRGERRAWWEARVDALASMRLEEFSAAYHISPARVSQVYKLFFGNRIRRKNWWRAKYPSSLLLSDLPRIYVADALGISVGAVGRLRWVLRAEAEHNNEA